MAPSQKRKSLPDDDFIHTISDNEPDILEEEVVAPPPKKAKTSTKNASNKKQNKKI
jgi:ATP-dependent RNA helicase DDX27